MGWGALLSLITGVLEKALLFFFVRKSGSDAVEKKVLEKTIEEIKIRDEIEKDTTGLGRDDIIEFLRSDQKPKRK